MTRAADVVDAARDAVAILEGNHPGGDFVDPLAVARDTLTDALIAHDAPRVPVDGGYGWDDSLPGLTIYAADGSTAITVKPGHYPKDPTERDVLVHQLAELLNLCTFTKPRSH